MRFEITQIEFDFSDDISYDPLTDEYKQEVFDEVVGNIWEVDDEEDLTDEITSATGWCIKSIDYRHVLK